MMTTSIHAFVAHRRATLSRPTIVGVPGPPPGWFHAIAATFRKYIPLVGTSAETSIASMVSPVDGSTDCAGVHGVGGPRVPLHTSFRSAEGGPDDLST